ncbi:MAG: hypothetical protein KDI79_14300 [Anaerolineae bacterium]|nr:hypothetical protein [Anaerolineae bacterium]
MGVKPVTILQQTRLAVTILIEDDSGGLELTIQLMTKLFVWLWRLVRTMAKVQREFRLLISDIAEAAVFTYKVMTIWLVALAYGLGIKL